MLKVYISSTYKDLTEERRAAADAVLMCRHLPIGMEHYTASEEKPLEVVRRDVRECDLFVGIYGLRYGFIPDGEQKSITHLEYVEAGAAGRPRLLFVRDEAAEWKLAHVDADRARIDAFRAEVLNQHVVSLFTTVDQLRYLVLGAVSSHRAAPQGQREVPHLLPYLCDRSEQETELEWALAAHRGARPDRPFVCVVHGDVHECHDTFVERMRKLLLPKYLGRGPGEPSPKQYDVEWPAISRRAPERLRLLLANLSAKLCDTRLADVARMSAAVAAQSVPVLVVTHTYWQTWAADEMKLFRGWLKFWSDWPPADESHQLVVVLCVHYETEPEANADGPPSRLHEKIHRQMESLKFADDKLSGVTLPPLRGIPLGEVHNWANVYGQEYRPADEVLQQARQFYAQLAAEGKSPHVPMEEMARLLRQWLTGAPGERQVN